VKRTRHRNGSPIAPRIPFIPDLAIDVTLRACSRRLGGDQIEDIRPGRRSWEGTHHNLDWTLKARHRFF
jgi:hypothetical protein